MTAAAAAYDRRAAPLAALAVLGGLAAFAALQLAAAARAGWVFEYPLDDVYIHLAMAAEIARGGYGVNAGEAASAASSALYPLLLTPFAETGLQRWLPLGWNVLGLGFLCFLWGRILGHAGYSGALGILLAVAGPVLVGAHSTAFAGMEHALHAAASLAVIYGLVVALTRDRLVPVLFAGLFFAPLFRFEGLAIGLLAALALSLRGWHGSATGAAALTVLPLAGFCAFLVSLGLDPLPNSVQAKLSGAAAGHGSVLLDRLSTFGANIAQPGGLALLGLVLAGAALPLLKPELRAAPLGLLSLVVVGAGLGHLVLGQVGWMERYEHYALAALGAAVLAMAAHGAGPHRTPLTAALVPLLISGQAYLWNSVAEYPWNTRAIHLQQGQMARFAQDYAQTDVAVNDLGRVVWGNGNHVLDLWGLASREALRRRLGDPAPGWGGPLVAARDVPLIMIYETWLGHAVAPEWVRLGYLRMEPLRGFLGGAEVAFYAATPEDAGYLADRLQRFAATLPRGAYFSFEEGPA